MTQNEGRREKKGKERETRVSKLIDGEEMESTLVEINVGWPLI